MSDINVTLKQAQIAAKISETKIEAGVRGAVVNVTQIGGGHFRRLFVAGDFAGGSLLLGTIETGKVIQQTVVEISEAFDAGYVTVGTASAQGILLTTGEAGNTANVFIRDNHYCPVATADYRIYFHGSPSVGAGSVTVYYS